jgi:hypothetical protein
MALLDAFKQQVLNLGRSEARAKARPLLVDDEAFDRSAAGLDRRVSEAFVLFWLLSDRALFLVAGGANDDWAFRLPFECIAEIALDFDETAETLPWYIRLTLISDGDCAVTTLENVGEPGKPLAAPLPRAIDGGEREHLAQGAIIPLAGFAVVTKKFRTALARRLELSGGALYVHGEDRAEAQRRLPTRRRSKTDE